MARSLSILFKWVPEVLHYVYHRLYIFQEISLPTCWQVKIPCALESVPGVSFIVELFNESGKVWPNVHLRKTLGLSVKPSVSPSPLIATLFCSWALSTEIVEYDSFYLWTVKFQVSKSWVISGCAIGSSTMSHRCIGILLSFLIWCRNVVLLVLSGHRKRRSAQRENIQRDRYLQLQYSYPVDELEVGLCFLLAPAVCCIGHPAC